MRAGVRQIDGSISSLLALERIMQSPKVRAAQASGKLTVLFDSGVRTGSDVFRALALGAQGVLRECHPVLSLGSSSDFLEVGREWRCAMADGAFAV